MIPRYKREMDGWFHRNSKNEREFQQLMARVNNAAGSTDYYIADMEYAEMTELGARFDMVAFKWLSEVINLSKAIEPLVAQGVWLFSYAEKVCGQASILPVSRREHFAQFNEAPFQHIDLRYIRRPIYLVDTEGTVVVQ